MSVAVFQRQSLFAYPISGAQNFRIEGINYFLMRDRRYELIGAHTPFRKMRRLEHYLWRHYLRGLPPGSHLGRRVERALSSASERIITIIGDLTRNSGSTIPIEDFIAFASFRSPIPNLVIYPFVIAFLGAVGAGLQPIGVEGVRAFASRIGFSPPSDIASNGIAIVVFFACAFFLPIVIQLLGLLFQAAMGALRRARNISLRLWAWGNEKIGSG